MGSSSLHDPIRKSWVEATPEEQVRQHLIQQLIKLGYPPALMVVEKALSELPHLKGRSDVPLRRIDVLCYAKRDSLHPLLLVECKAEPLSKKAERQLIGYNAFVGAPYIALVNGQEARFGVLEGGEWQFRSGLMPYGSL